MNKDFIWWFFIGILLSVGGLFIFLIISNSEPLSFEVEDISISPGETVFIGNFLIEYCKELKHLRLPSDVEILPIVRDGESWGTTAIRNNGNETIILRAESVGERNSTWCIFGSNSTF